MEIIQQREPDLTTFAMKLRARLFAAFPETSELSNICTLHELPVTTTTSSSISLNGDQIIELDTDVPNICSLHELPLPGVVNSYNTKAGDNQPVFLRSNLKVVRGVKQYLYDDNNVEFLDGVNGTAHVGHCHPQVVNACNQQSSKLAAAQGFASDVLSKYIKELVDTLPEPLSVCFLTNSGSEANDLALRLSGQYTGRRDVVCVEDSYHGNLGVLIDVSHKMHSKVPKYKKPDWVHVFSLPDTYRIRTEEKWEKYTREFDELVEQLTSQKTPVSAFILEPMSVIAGLHIPPASVIKSMFRSIRSRGGLIIADEVQTGLGRTGEYMWGFMNFEVVPDIVTIGKPLGNGHPMGAVICSRDVSSKLGGYFSTFGGNPVSCAAGLAVLEVLRNEKLMSSAKMVGRFTKASLEMLKDNHNMLGDIRGMGLVYALEIVENRVDSNTPDPKLATEVMYGLRQKNTLVAITGRNKNILLFTPPMCFNIENSRRLVKSLDEVLTVLESQPVKQSVIISRESLEAVSRAHLKRAFIGSTEVEAAKRTRQESEVEEGEGYEDMD